MIAQFALRLVCGMSWMWVGMRRDRITSGFFRIQMLLAMALSALAAIAMSRFIVPVDSQPPLISVRLARILAGVMTATAYIGSIVWTLDRRWAGNACVYAMALLSAAVLLGCSAPQSMLTSPSGALTLVSELSASSLIGAATAGMLLGHWYLTAPTMSIAPLNRMNVWFGSAAVVRLVTALRGLWLAWPVESGTPLVWLLLRWIAGIVGPLVLSVMIWRILRFRNTQAATGVFFVGVILTFIGELSAMLASRELHFPL
jgi:hypothetical protein